jgi:predicted O-methyltransferase YrrM
MVFYILSTLREELIDFQRKHFDKSPWEPNYATFRKRSWYNPTIDLKFDLVFADKENYLTYWELIVPKMNKGGIILSDNVLWVVKCLNRFKKRCQHQVLLEYNALPKTTK